ncbi:glycosyltransferase family 8 protein [Bombilactobacillus thymidiniphilus]|uniref:Glycosyltransferase family 8 protein n=1 Tax=Bombilactobacillus thymidiniphilus TaxID=2923363 RepID=A0ABY4PBG5_9LACO|nr:glycosyltransferase family 8 protein [Bombilactobacillus thymidiniphilus]UQS83113.1 glycosyltransferase family 8 protein [Bombilactobacillus thymidiniphilus]
MNNSNHEIPVFFSVDDHYAPYLAVALNSLVQNSNPDRYYHVIVLCDDLSATNQQQLQSLTQNQVQLEFVSITDQIKKQITDTDNKLRADYFTYTIYFRLFIAELFPQFDKAIYLDADTVVNTDIANLFDISLGANWIGAVVDRFIVENPETFNYAQQAIGVKGDKYVNSGVLLMDLKALRENHFADHFFQLLNKYHFRSLAPDQDYLNAIAKNKIQRLDSKWNVMITFPESTPAAIIHWNLFEKPWYYAAAPRQEYFWRYAKNTPYYEQLQQQLQQVDPTAVQKDDKNAAELMNLAVQIAKTDTTFRARAEQGVQISL